MVSVACFALLVNWIGVLAKEGHCSGSHHIHRAVADHDLVLGCHAAQTVIEVPASSILASIRSPCTTLAILNLTINHRPTSACRLRVQDTKVPPQTRRQAQPCRSAVGRWHYGAGITHAPCCTCVLLRDVLQPQAIGFAEVADSGVDARVLAFTDVY